MASKSLDQRLYEAWRSGVGVRLSIDDLDELLHDDALCTRISNQAAIEAGMQEGGADSLGNPANAPTWTKFVESFKETQ